MQHCFTAPTAGKLALPVLSLLLLCGSAPRAHAQAAPTQYKTQSISAYGGYTYDRVDIYPQGYSGGMVGLEFTRHIRFPVHPSLEGRANFVSGKYVNEKSYLVGFNGEYEPGRLHPYGHVMVGFGTVHYNPAAQQSILGDNSAVYALGAGLEVDVVRSFRAKLDFQHQYWNTGKTAATAFQPSLFSVGVTYQIPFKPFHRQDQPHYQ